MNPNVELFLCLESQYNMFDIEFSGVKIWGLLRLEVYRLIERQLLKSNLIPVPYRQVLLDDKIKYSYSDQAAYVKTLQRLYKDTEVLIVNNKHRFVEYDNQLYCPITGEIENILDKKVTYCTQVYNRGKYQCFNSPFEINYNLIPMSSKYSYTSNQLSDLISFIVSVFEEGYSINLDKSCINDICAMVSHVIKYLNYGDFYEQFLSNFSPLAIIFSTYYATINSVIISKAKKLHIPTIEMQHGIIGYEHVAYNSMSPRHNEAFMPEYLAAFGQFDAETPRHFVRKENIILAGNFFLNKIFRKGFSLDISNSKNRNYTVLIVSFNMGNERLIDFSLNLKNKHPEWTIIYRFHPEENISSSVETLLKNSGIICNKNFTQSIYSLIYISNLIIGTKSTVMLEALYFKKRVYILNSIKLYDSWSESEKKMPYIEDVSDLEEKLAIPTDNIEYTSLAHYFYYPDGERNFTNFMNSLNMPNQKG